MPRINKSFNHRIIYYAKTKKLFVVVLSIALIGSLLLLITNASSLFVQTELENASLSNGATKLSDSNASSGTAVVFNDLGSGGGELPPKPNLDNTGVQSGISLRKEPGTVISQDNTLIENVEFQGSVIVRANNVRMKNVRILGSGVDGIKQDRGYSGLVMEYMEITCPGCQDDVLGNYNNGVYGESAWTLRYSELSRYPDGAKIHNNQLVENNYFHSNQRVLGSNGLLAHTDGMQTTGGSNNIIRNNVFATDTRTDFDMGSNLMIQNEFAPVKNWVIEYNYFSGGNYSTYFNDKPSYGQGPHQNIIVRNNTFVKNSAQYGYTYPIGYNKQICYTAIDVKFINNKLDDGTLLNSCQNT